MLKKGFLFFLLMVTLFSVAAFPISAAEILTVRDIANTSVTEDLSASRQNGKGFDMTAYAKEHSSMELVTIKEAYANVDGKHALYVYVYCPAGQALDITSTQHKVTMSTSGLYQKYSLTYKSVSADQMFYKFQVNMSNASVGSSQYTSGRTYSFSDVELWRTNGTVASFAANKSYRLLQDDVTAVKLTVTERLDVTPITYYYNGDKTQQINSVYFSVPNKYQDTSAKLNMIHAEWLSATLAPVLFMDDTEDHLYEALYVHYIGNQIVNPSVEVKDLPDGYTLRDDDNNLFFYSYLYDSLAAGQGDNGHRDIVAWNYTGYDAIWGSNVSALPFFFDVEDGQLSISSAELEAAMRDYGKPGTVHYFEPSAEAFRFQEALEAAGYTYTVSNPAGYSNLIFSNISSEKTNFIATPDTVTGFLEGIDPNASAISKWLYETFTNMQYSENLQAWVEVTPAHLVNIEVPGTSAYTVREQEIANHLKVQLKDLPGLRQAVSNAALQDKTVILFRFEISEPELREGEIRKHSLLDPLETKVNVLLNHEVYLDFDVIELGYDVNGETVIVPVNMTSTDIIPDAPTVDADDMPEHEKADEPFDWSDLFSKLSKMIALILLVLLLLFAWPFVAPLVVAVVRAVSSTFKALFGSLKRSNKPKKPKGKK